MGDRKIAIHAINTREIRNKIKDLFGFDRFGENVFSEKIQKERLPDHIFLKLQMITKMGEELAIIPI